MPRGPPGRYPRLRQIAFPEPPCPSRAEFWAEGGTLHVEGTTRLPGLDRWVAVPCPHAESLLQSVGAPAFQLVP